jgi:ketosteroid isomerase-like protein
MLSASSAAVLGVLCDESLLPAPFSTVALFRHPAVEYSRTIPGGWMKSSTLVLVVAFCALVLATFVLPGSVSSGSASTKASAETLKQLEADFMKAAAEKGSAGYMSYYADDAVEVPNGAPVIQGKENIAKGMGFLDDKNNHLIWTPVGADISASGDLGYTYGNYEFHSKDKDGKPTVEHGKYTSIWKKQKDASWKVVLDMGNATAEPK